MTVLITGGTGALGPHLVDAMSSAGHDVRVVSRQSSPPSAVPGVTWVAGDLASGAGLRAAVRNVDVVVHAASDPRRARAVDVEGTRRLTQAARAAGVSHLVYVSIVGVDAIPLGYYQRKLEAEALVEASGVPWTILRATQFHSFVAYLLTLFTLPGRWRAIHSFSLRTSTTVGAPGPANCADSATAVMRSIRATRSGRSSSASMPFLR